MRAVSLRFLVVDIKACLHKATNIKSRKVWYNAYAFRNCRNFLSLSWPAGHICHTYKESFQVRWDNSIPLFLHAAIYLEVSLFRWTRQNAFSYETAHSIICTVWLFREKMHSYWFNGMEILQGRWQHGEKVRYCYPSGPEKTLCKWDIHVPLVTKGLTHSIKLGTIEYV